MTLQFNFDPPKSIQVLAYLTARLGQVEKVKLMKLVYLADREHFLKTGVSITGDRLVAMKHGPLPSNLLDVLNGIYWGVSDDIFQTLHINNNVVTVEHDPGSDRLSASETSTLDEILREYGGIEPWALVHQTHDLPEYRAVYREGTSRTIPFETIASLAGDERRFWHNRLVVSPRMRQFVPVPFTEADDDL